MSKLSVHQRARRGIGRTFQRIELFPDSTVRDHLIIADRTVGERSGRFSGLMRMWGSTPEERARIDEMLELLGLRDLADLPRAEELTIALQPHRPTADGEDDAAAYVEAES